MPLIDALMMLSTMLSFANLLFFLWWKKVIVFHDVNLAAEYFVELQGANSNSPLNPVKLFGPKYMSGSVLSVVGEDVGAFEASG